MEKTILLPQTRPEPPPSPAQSTHAEFEDNKAEDESNPLLPPTPESNDAEYAETKPEDELILPQPPTPNPTIKVLDVDKNTPDAHVPRDPRLIRLTGVHPFNCEGPLTDLFNEGFLTSPDLFYVRNHGPVPKVEDHECLDWQFTVEGLVDNPITLRVRDLMTDFTNITLPITLVCAGNRRKEQNVVRKSKGFSWGPAGLSTALFTGVTMADVIKKARPQRRARYVCMEGADELPNGFYGTSLKLNWVMDPNKGIMLSWMMNGEMLRPDHGKPLRAVVPGQIGGRSVKWLTRLILSEKPSDNWYHYYDNRLLPTMVSPEESANNPGWWKDERYAIYDLNTNSAIAYPAHDEQLRLDTAPEEYKLRGYAYGGGGRRVTRVEISVDKGKSWRLAEIEYPEDKYRAAPDQDLYGGALDMWWRETCFCWCFWSLNIAVSELKDSNDVFVRAMDESLHIQPRDMYWSVLGMMNNPWFRVVIHNEGDTLRFEHPTQPALMPGGWMERVKKMGGDLTNGYWGERREGEEVTDVVNTEPVKEIKMTKDDIKRIIGMDEWRDHDQSEAPWFAVNGEVFDGTAFLKGHPGGAQSILSAAGLDSTDEFMAIHSETAKAMMPDYHIGTLDEEAKKFLAEGEVHEASSEPQPTFLDTRVWKKVVLHKKTPVSWDSKIFTFKLEHDEQTLGLPVGQHLMLRLRDPVTREAIIRSYTPIAEVNDKGYVDILIKIYNDTPETKGGKMTMALDAIPVGHSIDIKGPIGKFEYLGKGRCSINGDERTVKRFFMICGGSGVTPIYQVFRAVMQDQEDPTTCTILNGNRLEEDILCREDMDRLMKGNEARSTLLHTLTQATESWTGLRGRIGEDLLNKHVAYQEESMVLICGPEALEESVHVLLNKQGWQDKDLLFF